MKAADRARYRTAAAELFAFRRSSITPGPPELRRRALIYAGPCVAATFVVVSFMHSHRNPEAGLAPWPQHTSTPDSGQRPGERSPVIGNRPLPICVKLKNRPRTTESSGISELDKVALPNTYDSWLNDVRGVSCSQGARCKSIMNLAASIRS